MIKLNEVIYDERARDGTWCQAKYPNHKDGCPNFPKCIASRGDFKDFGNDFSWYAVIEKFDLQAHAERMKEKHPHWTERQCRNLLYWQGGVRKRLTVKALKEHDPHKGMFLSIPEAHGINVFETMALVGINIERNNPKQITKVMMIGFRDELPEGREIIKGEGFELYVSDGS